MERQKDSYEERAQEVAEAPDEGVDQQHDAQPGGEDDDQSSRAEK